MKHRLSSPRYHVAFLATPQMRSANSAGVPRTWSLDSIWMGRACRACLTRTRLAIPVAGRTDVFRCRTVAGCLM